MTRSLCLVLAILLLMVAPLWSRGYTEEDAVPMGPTRGLEVDIPDMPDPSETRSTGWTTAFHDLSLSEGEARTLSLPPGGQAASVAGTGIYASYSSIGSAAVHAGLVDFRTGGDVTVLAIRGIAYYASSFRNDVYSHRGGRNDSSFVFLDDGGDILTIPIPINWASSAGGIPGGTIITVELPPGGADYFAFGSGPYDADSSVGTAAVHAGLISFAEGGVVTVEVLDSPPNRQGSRVNGVSTRDVMGMYRSFRFIEPE